MDAQFYIGCDLGGTNIKAGLVDLQSGQVISSKNTKHSLTKGTKP